MRLAVTKRRPTDRPATAIGLGWHIDSENALDIVWHNGGSGGSRSYVAFLPTSGVGVVVLSNSSDPVDGLGKKVLYLLHRQCSPGDRSRPRAGLSPASSREADEPSATA
jgi:CubicO group peptidase (beta-lactamase class C family)